MPSKEKEYDVTTVSAGEPDYSKKAKVYYSKLNVVAATSGTGVSSILASVPSGETKTFIEITEPGRNLHLYIGSNDSEQRYYLEVDGILLKYKNLSYITPYLLNATVTGGGFGINLVKYTEAGVCDVAIDIPFEWKTSFKLSVYNPRGSSINTNASINYLKLE